MDLDDQFELEHLFFTERKCRSCKVVRDLTEGFYRIRRNNTVSSSYSYECKECTIKRIKESRKKKVYSTSWEYPDW